MQLKCPRCRKRILSWKMIGGMRLLHSYKNGKLFYQVTCSKCGSWKMSQKTEQKLRARAESIEQRCKCCGVKKGKRR